MSASERLRELGVHPFDWYEASTQDGETLRLVPSAFADALPEIVEVVEAAERVEARMLASQSWDRDNGAIFILRRALAALEEKLTT